MKRALVTSILFNLIMLALTGFLFVRDSSLWSTTRVHIPEGEQYSIPRSEGDPLILGMIGCELSSDPQTIASLTQKAGWNSDPRHKVNVYVTEKDSIGSIVEFLKNLSSSGVTGGVRVVLSTATGPVTFEEFNTSPIGTFNDIQSFKNHMKGKPEQDGADVPTLK